jgi:hypothetical protein
MRNATLLPASPAAADAAKKIESLPAPDPMLQILLNCGKYFCKVINYLLIRSHG